MSTEENTSKTEEELNQEVVSEEVEQEEFNYEEEFDRLVDVDNKDNEDEEDDDGLQEQEEQDETPEEEDSPVEEGPSEEDRDKERRAVEAMQNDSDIPHDLINSIEDKELRTKVWSIANTAKSNHGRFMKSQQELQQVRQELDNLRRQQQNQPVAQNKQEQEIQDKDLDEKISRLKSDYPDLAESIDALADYKSNQKIQEVTELFDQKYGQMHQQYQEQRRYDEMQRLDQAANTIFDTENTGVSYRDVVASPEFRNWLDNQPASIKAFAESDNSAEVAHLLQSFETDYSREYRNQTGRDWREDVISMQNRAEETDPPANSRNTPSEPNGTSKADKVAQKRDKQRNTAVTGVRPARSAPNPDVPQSYEALFDQIAKQSAKQRQRR